MRAKKIFLVLIFLIVFSTSIVSAENTIDFFKKHINSTIAVWLSPGDAFSMYGTIVDVQDDFIIIEVNGRKQYISIDHIYRWYIDEKSKKE
jgi:hypothetical protein